MSWALVELVLQLVGLQHSVGGGCRRFDGTLTVHGGHPGVFGVRDQIERDGHRALQRLLSVRLGLEFSRCLRQLLVQVDGRSHTAPSSAAAARPGTFGAEYP
jgi:hypothetical protein